MTILQATPSAILDNFADAIEGGNSYRGSGTAHKGIPGSHSHHELAGTTLTADATTDTTTITADDIAAAPAAKLVRSDTPPMFLLCASQASGSGNVGAARKITAYASGSYTVAPAFAETVQSGDTFTLVEGFKRAPDSWDLESDAGVSGSFDRVFRLSMEPGTRHDRYGSGVQQFESTLDLRIRLLKRTRDRNARAAIMDNVIRMRAILTRPDVRDDNGVIQVLDASQTPPEVTIDDEAKLVIMDRYRIVYRVNATYQ